MNSQEYITKYQEKKIKIRLDLNFQTELKKSKSLSECKRFAKNFKTQIDILISEMYADGVMFYGFVMEKPYLKYEDTDMWYCTHLQVEYFVTQLRQEIELIEFCYIAIELPVDGVSPKFYGIIGVRSLLGKNQMHFNEMKKILDDTIDDIQLTSLTTPKKIKNYWNYVIKENNFKFHRFQYYSNNYQMIFGTISDLELQFDDRVAFDLDKFVNSLHHEISGIKNRKPTAQIKINYLINLYMIEHKMVLYENKIYKKIENSKYSWAVYDSIDFLEKNNILIFNYLKTKYPQQLNMLNIPKLFSEGWNVFFEDTKKNNHYLSSIKFTNNVIEFNDGVLYNYDFFPHSLIEEDFKTIFFVNSNFVELNNAKIWFNMLGINSELCDSLNFELLKYKNCIQ